MRATLIFIIFWLENEPIQRKLIPFSESDFQNKGNAG